MKTTRQEKKKVINRKDIDPSCPVDAEVIKILHAWGITKEREDVSIVGSQCAISTIKKIRKDVFVSKPDILDTDYTDAEIVTDEPIENTKGE